MDEKQVIAGKVARPVFDVKRQTKPAEKRESEIICNSKTERNKAYTIWNTRYEIPRQPGRLEAKDREGGSQHMAVNRRTSLIMKNTL